MAAPLKSSYCWPGKTAPLPTASGALLRRTETVALAGFLTRSYPQGQYCRNAAPDSRCFHHISLKASDRELVEQAKTLRASGFNPVPHLPARRSKHRQHLQDLINQLRGEVDVQQVLVIGGDGQPSGEYTSSLQLLETGLLDGLKVGVAGHPAQDRRLSLWPDFPKSIGFPIAP